jgi:ankyrin repeat protein
VCGGGSVPVLDSSGETALHAIALKNKVEEFKLLLTETKANVNLQNKYVVGCFIRVLWSSCWHRC